ncbi:MAG TPA: dipeptidase [Bacilli bacterium]
MKTKAIHRIFDNHCDVLSKMLIHPQIDFFDHTHLDVTLPRLREANVRVQSFAIYLPERLEQAGFWHVLRCVELFHEKILVHPEMIFVRSVEDLEKVRKGAGIGALLSLEGADGLHGNFTYLKTLFYLGVRSLGITWNYANWAADGVLEPRQGGLTLKGKKLVQECNKLGILIDVSHSTEKGFWEIAELSRSPLMASHSNVYSVCANARNLRKKQIEYLIATDGRMGLTFVPQFVANASSAVISQLIGHLDYVCAIGGVNHIGLGSDFDGIDQWVTGLEHTGKFPGLINELGKHFKDTEIEGFLYRNWYEYYAKNLPVPI